MNNHKILENKDLSMYVLEGNLVIQKKRDTKKENEIFLIVLMPLAFIAIVLYFWLVAKTKIGFDGLKIAILSIFLFIIVLSYINILIKTLRNIKNMIISKNNDIISVNGKTICSRKDLKSVIIQPSYGYKGLGKSSTIGIVYADGSFPITYFHGYSDAQQIANVIGDFFQEKVVTRRPLLFVFFNKW